MNRSLMPLALLLIVGAAHADGLPLENGRYPGPVIIFHLGDGQKKVIDRYRSCQIEHPNTMNVYSPYIFKLRSSQAKALIAKTGFSPSRFAVYETYREFNDAGPRWNIVMRFSEDEIEVPLDLLVWDGYAMAEHEWQGGDAFNPCFPEMLAP